MEFARENVAEGGDDEPGVEEGYFFRGDGLGVDCYGEEEECALGFEAEDVEVGGFAGDEVEGGGGEVGGFCGPGPGGVGADDMGEGFSINGVVLEGGCEDEPAGGVGCDGLKEGLAVLEEGVAEVGLDEVEAL